MSDTTSKPDYRLTYDAAVALLPDDGRIHTFLNPAEDLLIGADWDREDVLALLLSGQPELSGEQATAAGHGLVAWRGEGGRLHPVFIQTRPGTLPGDQCAAARLGDTTEAADHGN